jgi:hypothetical protein
MARRGGGHTPGRGFLEEVASSNHSYSSSSSSDPLRPPAVSRLDLLLVVIADPLLQGVETKASAGEDGEVRGRVTAKGRGRRRATARSRPRQGRVTARGGGCTSRGWGLWESSNPNLYGPTRQCPAQKTRRRERMVGPLVSERVAAGLPLHLPGPTRR